MAMPAWHTGAFITRFVISPGGSAPLWHVDWYYAGEFSVRHAE
jgi:hypothetical protein